jgi:outer membrane immunogenic protein
MKTSRRIAFAAANAPVGARVAFAAVAIGAILGVGVASAADIPPRSYTKAPTMVAEVYDWTGFYVGGNVGGIWGRTSGTNNFLSLESIGDTATNPQANALRNSAVIGGIHAGYNWQMARWVFGVEADFDWTDSKAGFCRQTDVNSLPCRDNGFGFLTLNEKTEWLGSVRGRLGYAWERFMIYGTGGAAWGKVDASINANCLAHGCGDSFAELNTTANFSDTKVGWVAGAGVEAMLNANWIVRVEYLHYDLGQVTNTLNLRADPLFPQEAPWSRSLRYDTVRAGLSYKFGGPAAAKY